MDLVKVESHISPNNLVPVVYDTTLGKFVLISGNMAYKTVEYHLPFEVLTTVEWARKKMAEEQQLAELIQSNPAIRDAKTALDVLLALNKSG